jgi:hypothetical protein
MSAPSKDPRIRRVESLFGNVAATLPPECLTAHRYVPTAFNQAASSFSRLVRGRSGIIKTRHPLTRAQAGATQSAKAGVEIARGRVMWRVISPSRVWQSADAVTQAAYLSVRSCSQRNGEKTKGDDSALRRGVFTLRNRAETQGTKEEPR